MKMRGREKEIEMNPDRIHKFTTTTKMDEILA